MRAVVFDAMGVLYRSSDDLAELLIPFARRHGSRLTDEAIGALYRQAIIGLLTSSELWRQLGVEGDGADLDRTYLSGYQLMPGMLTLLDELRNEGVRLGCISNDIAEWSRARRVRHGLDRRIGHWTISGEVGARKPDERIYRAFVAGSGVAPEDVVFVDDRARNLKAAALLGFDGILVDLAGVGHEPGSCVTAVPDLRAALAARVRHTA